jgi:hypothetical protein
MPATRLKRRSSARQLTVVVWVSPAQALLRHLGSPTLDIPPHATGVRIESTCSEHQDGVVIEWSLPDHCLLDATSGLVNAVVALGRAGIGASLSVRRDAAAALSLLVHAPEAHVPSALWRYLPPLPDIVALLPLCAELPAVKNEPSLLLLVLQLLAALAAIVPQQLAVQLQRCTMLWSEKQWLPDDTHAKHASMLLQTLHSLASCTVLPRHTDGFSTSSLFPAYRFVAVQLFPASGGAPPLARPAPTFLIKY